MFKFLKNFLDPKAQYISAVRETLRFMPEFRRLEYQRAADDDRCRS